MTTQSKGKLVLPSIVALVAVVGLAVSIVYAFPASPASTQVSALPTSLCSSATLPPTNVSAIGTFQVKPGSAAVICVIYSFSQSGSYVFTPTYGQLTTSGYHACGSRNGTTTIQCPDLSITASQSSFDHSANQNVTIGYTIVAGKALAGSWWFFIAPCEAIPLTINGGPASVSYPNFGCTTLSSTPAPTSVNIAGVWNLNVTSARG